MALNFPLSLSDFFDDLPVANVTFKADDNRSFTETGGGELITAARGARLWGGQITLDIDSHAKIAAVEAKMSLLEQAGASFMIYDLRKPYPTSDPLGASISGASPRISALNVNNREVDLSGLPSGYVISPGDMIAWEYGSSPTRYALHRVVTGGTASGGLLASVELTPFLRPGTAVNTPVSLIRPACKAVIDKAAYGSGRSVITQGGSFNWRQTLR